MNDLVERDSQEETAGWPQWMQDALVSTEAQGSKVVHLPEVLDKVFIPDSTSAKSQAEAAKLLKEATGDSEVNVPVEHFIHDGQYVRTLFAKAGTSVVGCIHKETSILIVHGHALVQTQKGIERIQGYAVIPTHKGEWRMVYAIEDTIFTNVHPNVVAEDLREMQKIQEALIDESTPPASNTMPLELGGL